MQGVVIEELGTFPQVTGDNCQRRRHDAEGHLQGHGGTGGVDTTAHPAGPAGDVNGIGRFASLQNDLIAAKQRGLSASLHHPPALEVDDGMK